MEPQLIPINIGNVSDGALAEIFDIEWQKVLTNINDPSTSPTGKRTITIKLIVKPEPDRQRISTTITAASTLAGILPKEGRVYIGRGTDGNVYAFAEDPRQQVLFTPPTPKEPENVGSFQPAAGR